ncbi:unnamed protein product [Rotaria magnacalcarata]|uniref:Oxysterol-binding protein n=2 Tax=Rotaria magnacalcarata TaxID=392030 RepID=A0A820EZP5_9BILA|nr:unnamed protein product [Rotaria magnacalcarata]
MGFDSELIGGSPFQLPSDYRIGSSYILFVGATWLTVISTLMTNLLVLISVSKPRWLLSVNQGETSIGLIEMCILTSPVNSNNQKCFISHQFRLVWSISFGLALVAFALLSVTVVLLVTSQYTQAPIAQYGRLAGFIAMIFLCLSSILFPMGFDSELIGGSPFQLPSDYRIGSSYILFVGATWLTVISTLMKPLSFLQRLSEGLEYSSLLDQAASANTSIERFHCITAFIVSNLSTHLERTSKPFNPLLGETFELRKENDSPFHFIAEQVSHHPPVSALYARGSNWVLTANIEPIVKFHGTTVVATCEGRWVLHIKRISRSSSQSSFYSCSGENSEQDEQTDNKDNGYDEYTWQSPTAVVHNILFGYLWCEFQGEINLQHIQTNQRAILTIQSHSWFATQATRETEMFKFIGYIYDGDDKLAAFHGNYGHCYYAIDDLKDVDSITKSCCSIGGNNCIHFNSNPSLVPPCNLVLTPSSRLIWFRCFPSMTDEELAARSQYYYFTPFTMSLNEPILPLSTLPPTDCRYRSDVRFLEQSDLDAASSEKHRLEQQQRAEAKNREGDYQPLWFKQNDNKEYIYTHKYEQRNFERCPNLFFQESSLS